MEDRNKQIEEYELTNLTFEIVSAPFATIKTLLKLVENKKLLTILCFVIKKIRQRFVI